MSPIGAAALPPPMKTKEKVEQGKETADHLMTLGYLFVMSQFLSLEVLFQNAFWVFNLELFWKYALTVTYKYNF